MRTWLEYIDVPSFIYGIIFLFFLSVVRKIVTEKTIKLPNTETGLHDWVQKKDLIYWLIIVMVCVISHYTYKYKDSSELISHWSFGGTIVSIILAIIAIVYTFYDNFTSKSSVQQLDNSSQKIKEITEKLDSSHLVNSSNKIGDISVQLESIMENMGNKLKNINTELTSIQKMNEQSFSDVAIKLDTIGLNLTGKNDGEDETASPDENSTELSRLLSAYSRGVLWNKIALICLLLASEKKIILQEAEIDKLSGIISEITSPKSIARKKTYFTLMKLTFFNTINILKVYGLTSHEDNPLELSDDLKELLKQNSAKWQRKALSSPLERTINKNSYEVASEAIDIYIDSLND